MNITGLCPRHVVEQDRRAEIIFFVMYATVLYHEPLHMTSIKPRRGQLPEHGELRIIGLLLRHLAQTVRGKKSRIPAAATRIGEIDILQRDIFHRMPGKSGDRRGKYI